MAEISARQTREDALWLTFYDTTPNNYTQKIFKKRESSIKKQGKGLLSHAVHCHFTAPTVISEIDWVLKTTNDWLTQQAVT